MKKFILKAVLSVIVFLCGIGGIANAVVAQSPTSLLIYCPTRVVYEGTNFRVHFPFTSVTHGLLYGPGTWSETLIEIDDENNHPHCIYTDTGQDGSRYWIILSASSDAVVMDRKVTGNRWGEKGECYADARNTPNVERMTTECPFIPRNEK